MIERRKGKRFEVDWPIKVKGTNSGGVSFIQTGKAENISSGGALLRLSKPLPEGTRLDLYIQLPMRNKRWMKYSALIVRIEGESPAVSAAVKFDSARPMFADN